MTTTVSVIVVAGGSGSRFGVTDAPKQFINLKGEPVLFHTLKAFYKFSPSIEIVLVLPSNQMKRWNELIVENEFTIPHSLVAGGTNRFESVKNGLQNVQKQGVICVHDGVRPLVSNQVIERCVNQTVILGTAVPVIPCISSLRMINSDKSTKSFDRSKIVEVQTPQCFKYDLIAKAYQQEYNSLFTDDASVVESSGTAIHHCEGDPRNIKITYPSDLRLAESLMLPK